MIRTKIICTLGPACDNDETMRGLLENGMDCARMNFSHGDHEEHLERLNRFRRLRDEMGLNTPVLLDTKGPEIRTGKFEKAVEFVEGEQVIIRHADVIGTNKEFSISYKELHNDISKGQRILIDDGLVAVVANKIDQSGDIHCTVENGGSVSSHKSVNIPGEKINLPGLTLKDEADILFAIEHDYDFIAVSFVRTHRDVKTVRKFLDKNGGANIQILSKIENQEGVDNIDKIIAHSDGIMVARGDLGVEIPVEKVPVVQKQLVKKSLSAFKIVIIATQMLDSMIRNPRPTRAETSDVANAIFDGTTCTMLSGETANGKYPVEALKTMRKIAECAEDSISYWGRLRGYQKNVDFSVTDAISMATCTTAMDVGARCIVTVTQSGKTARAISRFHPDCPILCAATDIKVVRQLCLAFGVFPHIAKPVETTDGLFDQAIDIAKKSGIVQDGDIVVITAGTPVGVSGTTNTLKVEMIGDVIAEGKSIGDESVTITGPVCILDCQNFEDTKKVSNMIVAVNRVTEEILPLLRDAKAIIVEGSDSNRQARAASLMLGIPVIIQANGATIKLKDGSIVTLEILENSRGIVKHA